MKNRLILLSVVLLAALAFVSEAPGHYRKCQPSDIACKSHITYHASLYVFCGPRELPCYEGIKAWKVASCETGRTFNRYATNGQYHGLWQMGHNERRICGQTLGRDPWTQARAARCWRFTHPSGWGGWSCG